MSGRPIKRTLRASCSGESGSRGGEASLVLAFGSCAAARFTFPYGTCG